MTKYNILTLNQISSHGLHRFTAARYAVGKAVEHPDAILVRSHDMHALRIPESVKAIGRAGAGTNNIPVAEMSKRGVPVFNAPGANANAVKELVFTALLLAARNVIPALAYGASLEHGPELDKRVEEGKKQFAGIELPQRTLGIVGLGAIGGLVADTAIKLGMKVIGFDPEITVDAAWRLPSSVRKANSIEEVLKASDFITLHVPLLPVTRHLIDAKRLGVMKAGAVLLNFARDAIVDEDAVVEALRAHRLKYYLCDFPSARLLGAPGVVALPHLGASTEEAEENCAIMVVDQVREYLEHGTIANAVNFPAVEMARESPFRIAIANANVPNMLGQISTTMANAGLNIHTMVNKSRGETAFTLVDVDSPIKPAVIKAIAAIERELARRLNVPLEIVPYTAAGQVVEDLKSGAWDVAYLAIDPARAVDIRYSAPYVVIEGAYLVSEGSTIRRNEDVDRDGVRVVVGKGSAYDLFLSRELRKATLVHAPTSQAVTDLFVAQNLDVAAGVKQQLEADAKRIPGLRLLEGRFMVINQAMRTPKGREAGAQYLGEFVEDMKASGFVDRALARHGIEGATVAPPASR